MLIDEIPTYSREHFPFPILHWPVYRKKVATKAWKIDGPFRVETPESENEPFYCEDGYLAIDSRGYPYAIATEEFENIYEPIPVADSEPKGPIGA